MFKKKTLKKTFKKNFEGLSIKEKKINKKNYKNKKTKMSTKKIVNWNATKVFKKSKRKPIIPVGVIMPRLKRKKNIFNDFVNNGPELKYKTEIDSLSCTNTGVLVSPVCPVATGNSNATRIGNKIIIKSISYSHEFTPNTIGIAMIGSVALIYDNDPKGAVPGITDIFSSVNPMSLTNNNGIKRYRVLMFDEFVLDQVTGTQVTSNATRKKYIRCNLPQLFLTGNANDVTDYSMGCLYLVYRCQNSVGFSAISNTKICYLDA